LVCPVHKPNQHTRSQILVFSTDKKAPIGLNRVLLAISFVSPDGTTTTQTEILGIHVKGRAKIGIASVSLDPVRIKKGDQVPLIIRLEKTGTDNANSVKASIDLPMSGERMPAWERLSPTTEPWQSLPCRPANPGSGPYNLTVR
jgi:hypothetical protein